MATVDDITAVIRVRHPDLALTQTIRHDPSAEVRPISGAGTDPETGKYLYNIASSDFDRFEEGLVLDPTIAAFERVTQTGDEAIYRFEYSSEAKLISPAIATASGVALEITNDGPSWIITVWLPERAKLAELWEQATEEGLTIELQKVKSYAGVTEMAGALTERQREALSVALNAGYFEEPRNATLEEIADELGISQPAAGGRLRRGLRRLVIAAFDEQE